MNYQEMDYMISKMNNVTYPEFVNIEPDLNFAKMLYDSYAGAKSELTAVLTYMYEYLTNEDAEDVSMLLKMISRQEMKHLELLGEILVFNGLNPYFMSSYGNKWCSDMVKCSFKSIYDMLEHNILSEHEAISEYTRLISICSNQSIKEVLRRIIADEENHIQIFEMLKSRYIE